MNPKDTQHHAPNEPFKKLFTKKPSLYPILSYSFRGNYSFLNLEIQRSQYIRSNVTVHKCAETIQGRKLFKGGNYMRKYGISNFTISSFFRSWHFKRCAILKGYDRKVVIRLMWYQSFFQSFLICIQLILIQELKGFLVLA